MRHLVLAAAVLVAAGCKHAATVYPTCGDNVVNGDETDVDCGGPLCTPCNTGKRCLVDKDCRSLLCAAGNCAPSACDDGVQNGSETDIDCGGIDCAPCAAGLVCAAANDCQSRVCVGARCQAPSCTDGFQNGDESGIDCGGSCPPCDAAAPTPSDLSSPRDLASTD